MTRVTPRARSRPDRGGDPLEGLVNLFELGIVLAVAFLLAALASLDLADVLTRRDVKVVREGPDGRTIVLQRGEQLRRLEVDPDAKVAGQGDRVGAVYRLADGRLVYVAREP